MEDGARFPPDADDPELVAHERTYRAFNILLRWSMTLLAASMVFLTMWLATEAGFWGAALVGLVILYAGWRFLVRHEARQPLDPRSAGR